MNNTDKFVTMVSRVQGAFFTIRLGDRRFDFTFTMNVFDWRGRRQTLAGLWVDSVLRSVGVATCSLKDVYSAEAGRLLSLDLALPGVFASMDGDPAALSDLTPIWDAYRLVAYRIAGLKRLPDVALATVCERVDSLRTTRDRLRQDVYHIVTGYRPIHRRDLFAREIQMNYPELRSCIFSAAFSKKEDQVTTRINRQAFREWQRVKGRVGPPAESATAYNAGYSYAAGYPD